MEKYLSPKVLKARLRENGHQVCLVPGTGSHVGIAFAPKTIMTVALYTDPTLRKRFRNSFFLCNWKRPGSVLKELGCPKEFSRNWTSVLSALRPGEDKDFLASAATWTLGRLVCHKRVLMWANAETSLSRRNSKHCKGNGRYPANSQSFSSLLVEERHQEHTCLPVIVIVS